MFEFAVNKTPYPPCTCDQQGTFSYESLNSRVPYILNDIIETVLQEKEALASAGNSHDSDVIKAADVILEELRDLKQEMATDKPLTPLPADPIGDAELWNSALSTHFPGGVWSKTPFLVWETYMYRRVSGVFARSIDPWRNFDFFFGRKTATFHASKQAVYRLAGSLAKLIQATEGDRANSSLKGHQLAFIELLHGSLWGNQTDLSMFPDMDDNDVETLQRKLGSARDDAHIVHDDSDKIWKYVSENLAKGGRIDIVLDNAGFELYMDLLLAHWLTVCGYASKIYFHCKRIPWYVSDVRKSDFHWLVDTCVAMNGSDETRILNELASEWRSFLDTGKWVLEDDLYWTGLLSYHYLPEMAPELWRDVLQKGDLLIFKGDLNYRKLTHDLEWPHATPFVDALGVLAGSAAPIVALRTSKAETVVGIDQQRGDELNRAVPNWKSTGRYGVIQFSPGKNAAASVQ
ncbi:Hairy/enhancer-of-split with YRPW motif protein 2 [Spiromyces aspiralis]|uniref:Hairy/enhancer-of-split with YRPW motif protein 2 n=1 Tax=Spiromyces aspiralis TaxID=68401 RepID=A0ACC1HH76_9FUNG|nr:Hairy/enhancer-of-split with YRPW motif protein 2 [Spiromyces aspiralis]